MWSHHHIVVIVIFIDVHFIIATYISYALASKSSQINFMYGNVQVQINCWFLLSTTAGGDRECRRCRAGLRGDCAGISLNYIYMYVYTPSNIMCMGLRSLIRVKILTV